MRIPLRSYSFTAKVRNSDEEEWVSALVVDTSEERARAWLARNVQWASRAKLMHTHVLPKKLNRRVNLQYTVAPKPVVRVQARQEAY